MKKSKVLVCGMTVVLTVLVSSWTAWGADVPANVSVKAPVSVPAEAQASAPAKASAIVQANTPPLESYRYNPAGKHDPFVPFIDMDPRKKKLEKSSSASIFPLQNANIDQFKLVGIAGSERGRVAAVEDERGKVYTISEGTYIGQNKGRVKSILADRLIVEETFGTDSGKARINRITMKLHKEDNEGKP